MGSRTRDITLGDEQRARAVESIRRYAEDQLDEPIGELKATLLLEFVLKEIAPTVHNRALRQAQEWLTARMGDLDSDCHQPEFGYWDR